MNTKAKTPGIHALNPESLVNTVGGHPGIALQASMIAQDVASIGFNKLHRGKQNALVENHNNSINELNKQTDQVIGRAVSSINDNQESSQVLHQKLDMLNYFVQHS